MGKIPGEGHGSPLRYSCLENPMDRGAWWAAVHGVAESDMTERLSLSLSLILMRQNKFLLSTAPLAWGCQQWNQSHCLSEGPGDTPPNHDPRSLSFLTLQNHSASEATIRQKESSNEISPLRCVLSFPLICETSLTSQGFSRNNIR